MPALVIAGTRFECRDALPPYRLMELASAMSSDDVMKQLGGLHDFVLAVVLPDERAAFRTFMHTLDDDEAVVDKLNEAVGTLMEEYTDRPTERPSASPPGADSTGRSSRVVSLSRGTDREAETS